MFAEPFTIKDEGTGVTATLATAYIGPDIELGQFEHFILETYTTALTGTNVTYYIDRRDQWGNYHQVFASSAVTAAGTGTSDSIGHGLAPNEVLLGNVARVRAAATGTSASATFDYALWAR